MKKLILVGILIIGVAFMAYAGDTVILLDKATAAGAGTPKWVASHNASVWGCDVVITGKPSTVKVRIEGNQGLTTNFDTTGMSEQTYTNVTTTARKISSFYIADKPAKVIRANVITFTNGSTVSVSCSGK